MYPYDEYYDDYEDYDDYEVDDDGTHDTVYHSYLCKREDGVLFVKQIRFTRFSGQDWGEVYGVVTEILLDEYWDEYANILQRLGAGIKPGTEQQFSVLDIFEQHIDALNEKDLPE